MTVNARDAMPNGGKLIIETANVHLDEEYVRSHLTPVAGDYVMLSVTDTGVGIDAETKSHLFEPFFTTKEIGKGTGLGLSTSYGIIKQNGGDVWVYSELGKGTTFKVYLPVAGQQPVARAQRPETTMVAGYETVLLVEDEAGVRTVSKRCCGVGLRSADLRHARRCASSLRAGRQNDPSGNHGYDHAHHDRP